MTAPVRRGFFHRRACIVCSTLYIHAHFDACHQGPTPPRHRAPHRRSRAAQPARAPAGACRPGLRTTQATLSRDLAELGVLKGAGGYRLQDGTPEPSGDALDALARRLLAGIERAGNLVVLHTPPGQASALAVQLDRTSMRGVVGTIAGDDCVFVATRTPTNAKELVRRLTVAGSSARRKATA